MPCPATKTDLLCQSQANFEQLFALINFMPDTIDLQSLTMMSATSCVIFLCIYANERICCYDCIMIQYTT